MTYVLDSAAGGATYIPGPRDLDYMQMVRVSGDTYSTDRAVLAEVVLANSGMTWIIGNELDSIRQDSSTPEQYACVYHQLYTTLKGIDPTSRVAIGGIVQVTPLRLQWLDAVLDTYASLYGQPFPTDLRNIHTFVLQEKSCAVYPLDCWGAEIPPGVPASSGVTEGWGLDDHDRLDLIAGQIIRFREWMRDHGADAAGCSLPRLCDPLARDIRRRTAGCACRVSLALAGT